MTEIRRLRSGDEGGHRSCFIFSYINIPVCTPSVKYFFRKSEIFSRLTGKIPTVMLLEPLCVFLIGAGLYGAVELLWRGYSHWTMLLCGGACFTLMYFLSGTSLPLWLKCLISAAIISLIEFAVGYLVNIILGWRIWDYSDRPLNLMGQICPLYSFFWLILSVPAMRLCSFLRSL